MSESTPKENLRALAEQTVQRVAQTGPSLQYFGGASAFEDPSRDDIVTGLPAFGSARSALGSVPMVREWYGSEPEWGLLALKFIYGFLGNLPEPTFDPGIFEDTWAVFWAEVSEPEWTWIALANLRNFRSESNLLDLGDGVTIRSRSFEDLVEMGCSEWILERLGRELLEEGMTSSHVIITEHKMPKTPKNFRSNTDPGY